MSLIISRYQLKRQRKRLAARVTIPLRAHVALMALHSPEDYLAWREAHGFGRSLEPTAHERRRELELRRDELAREALRARRRAMLADRPELIRMMRGGVPAGRRLAWWEQCYLHAHRRARDLGVAGPYQRLVKVILRSKVFSYFECGNSVSFALVELAMLSKSWRRRPEEWTVPKVRASRQLASLLRFLMARYDVPAFLDKAWFDPSNETGVPLRNLWLAIGAGQSPRSIDGLPLTLSKRMVGPFLDSPSWCAPAQALRRAQAVVLGLDAVRADALCRTRIGFVFADDAFWQSVIRWLAANPSVEPDRYGQVIDWVTFMREVPQVRYDAVSDAISVRPPNRNFSMRGRTATSVLREVERREDEVDEALRGGFTEWFTEEPKSLPVLKGVQPFAEIRTSGIGPRRIWSIAQVLTDQALWIEGQVMKHCVADYVDDCRSGTSSIWSVRMAEGHASMAKRRATVEISPGSRKIVEAKGPTNSTPDAECLSVINAWALREGLGIELRDDY